MKPIRWILLVSVILWGIGILSGCSTVKGAGEDLNTLGTGMSKYHQTPTQIQQENVSK